MADAVVLGTELDMRQMRAMERLFAECFSHLFSPFCGDERRLARAFRGALNPERMFAALADGEPVGFLLYSTCSPPYSLHLDPAAAKAEFGAAAGGAFASFTNKVYCDRNKVQYVNEIYVEFLGTAAEARGRGIATALLERVHAETWCDLWKLDVLESNAAARRLYEKLGYETTDIRYAALGRLVVKERTVYMERRRPDEESGE